MSHVIGEEFGGGCTRTSWYVIRLAKKTKAVIL